MSEVKDERYTVRLEVFEGPLELLLQLIEKRKLHISDVSLAKITDDYIDYVGRLNDFPLRDAAQFILIASTLVLIKSRSLLPSLPLTEEEQESIADLERRLMLYKRTKELSRVVAWQYGRAVLYHREQSRSIAPVFSPTKEVTKQGVLEAIRVILRSLPRLEMIPQLVVEKVLSVEEMIESLTERIASSLQMSFKDFAKQGKKGRVGVVASFLAVLELVKRGIIRVKQDKHFEDIVMETSDVGVPKYH